MFFFFIVVLSLVIGFVFLVFGWNFLVFVENFFIMFVCEKFYLVMNDVCIFFNL